MDKRIQQLYSDLAMENITGEEFDRRYAKLQADRILYPTFHTTDTSKWTEEERSIINKINNERKT
jgi:hypothetical protein